MNSGVYKIFRTNTGECCYVGSAARLNIRKSGHYSLLRRGKHKNKLLQTLYNRGDALEFEVLEHCPITDLLDRENEWIEKLNPTCNSDSQNARKTKGCAEANINFSCTPDMVAAVDAFAERHGMASRGHAMRRIVQTVVDTPQTRDK